MVFEPNFTKVVSSVRRNVGITQSVIELKLPTNEENINKIYSVGAKSTVVSSESNGKDISFMGHVDFQAIYEGEQITAIDYTAEFRDKFLADREITGELIITSNVVDVTSNSLSNGIKVMAIIEVSIDEIMSRDVNVLTSISGECVHTTTTDLKYSTYIGKAFEKFDVSSDIQLENVANVLMVTPSVCLNSVQPKDNYLVLNGRLNVNICYKSGDNIQDLSTKEQFVDFTWEVALEGINPNSIIQSLLNIIYNEIRVSTVINGSVANISLNIPITFTGYVFNENNLEVVDDLYLESNYLSITCENFETIVGNESVKFKDNISGIASISDTAPFIDEILGVSTNNLVVASSRIDGDKLCIEGIANATVIYFTKETSSITSVQVEMPFAVEERISGMLSNIVTICLESMNARSKRGKEIEVSGELVVFADTYNEKTLCAISNVNLGEEKPHDDCSLYLYIVKPNQTIWDVSKDINVSQEAILEQNPEVELPLKSGDKLVIYKPNMMKF